jgi:dephospho-CoA kinase
MKPQGRRIMEIVAIVGMTGAGKSEVARLFEENGFKKVRFGDITDKEIKKQGLEFNEENERRIREQLRRNYGMAAYAMLNLSRIDLALKKFSVVIDGLYSWEEYSFLSNYYRERFGVVAVWSSPTVRHARLANRSERPLSKEEAASRDEAEIMNLNKSGPIAMADFTIQNEATFKNLGREVKRVIAALRRSD